MSFDWYNAWKTMLFLLSKYTTIWILFTFIAAAGGLWQLSVVLEKHKIPRLKETRLARCTAFLYIALTITLWVFSTIFG